MGLGCTEYFHVGALDSFGYETVVTLAIPFPELTLNSVDCYLAGNTAAAVAAQSVGNSKEPSVFF
jgi:hypothetical protein